MSEEFDSPSYFEGALEAFILEVDRAKKAIDSLDGFRIPQWKNLVKLYRDKDARLTRALDVLKKLEWHDEDSGVMRKEVYYHCPICHWSQIDGHAPDCILASALESIK